MLQNIFYCVHMRSREKRENTFISFTADQRGNCSFCFMFYDLWLGHFIFIISPMVERGPYPRKQKQRHNIHGTENYAMLISSWTPTHGHPVSSFARYIMYQHYYDIMNDFGLHSERREDQLLRKRSAVRRNVIIIIVHKKSWIISNIFSIFPRNHSLSSWVIYCLYLGHF